MYNKTELYNSFARSTASEFLPSVHKDSYVQFKVYFLLWECSLKAVYFQSQDLTKEQCLSQIPDILFCNIYSGYCHLRQVLLPLLFYTEEPLHEHEGPLEMIREVLTFPKLQRPWMGCVVFENRLLFLF